MTAPLVPLPILATRAVVVPKAAVILQSIVAIAWLYALTMYFQGVLSNVPLTIAGSTGTGDKGRGPSAGLVNPSTQLGTAVGLGVVASVAASAAATLAINQTSTIQTLLAGLQWGLLACAIFALRAPAVVLLGLPSKDATDR